MTSFSKPQAVECGFVFRALQAFVDLAEIGIFRVVAIVLPASQIDDFGSTTGNDVKAFDDIQGLCKGQVHLTFLATIQLFGQ
jgi:hypothetical protein